MPIWWLWLLEVENDACQRKIKGVHFVISEPGILYQSLGHLSPIESRVASYYVLSNKAGYLEG